MTNPPIHAPLGEPWPDDLPIACPIDRIYDATKGLLTYAEMEAVALFQSERTGASDYARMSADELSMAMKAGGSVRKNRDGSIAILKNAASVARLAGS